MVVSTDAVSIANMVKESSRMKHIYGRFNLVKILISNEIIKFIYFASLTDVADLFTTSLDILKLDCLRWMMASRGYSSS